MTTGPLYDGGNVTGTPPQPADDTASQFDVTYDAYVREHSVTDARRDGWGDYDLDDAA